MDEHKAHSLAKLLSLDMDAAAPADEPLVRTAEVLPGRTMPLRVEPSVDDLDPVSWAAANRDWIETRLRRHGALLLRGFGLGSVPRFESFAGALVPDLFGEYGDLPAEQGGQRVYQSTPYPPNKSILFHNESSHLDRWPLKQMFMCVQPAAQGGETPLLDCRETAAALPAEMVRRFESKGLLYVRNFSEGLDVSWQDFFRTQDPAVVEDHCRRAHIDWEWTPTGLRTRQAAVAVARHPKTGDKVFFNQLQLHHVACLEPELREALGAIFPEDEFPRNVYYGDGSRIEDSILAEISATYRRHAVVFPWQQGDVLVLDNMLVAHGRNPFAGPRKVVVAMGEMFAMSDLAA